ncbi:sensor histidine kinase [Ilyomonas limi]|uniref:histidine kinase n=1 Tax=Ilyomonas limi TaxID=2575867 RepID=A0A4U3LC07_9BACT|nr:ATP-binding protein [Ilyomonas limi]TKK71596.1 sensor histidine kinase [Ilyomonas limi]
MIRWLNLRNILAAIAIIIVSGSIIYSRYLSQKIAKDEKQRVENWVEAQRTIMNTETQTVPPLAIKLIQENVDIPIIETDEKDSITNYRNIDSTRVANDVDYLKDKLRQFKAQRAPIILKLSDTPYIANRYYYGESRLQQEVRYYPIVQLLIIGLFITVVIIAQRSSYRSTQNQLWAGMAKETAHQLGTPVTSLQGWVEMLKEIEGASYIAPEIEKDVNRLLLITDRFGKIGSTPRLEERNLVEQVQYMLDYMRKRAGGKVQFIFNTHGEENIPAMISPPLFDWVVENLLKNGLDAMDGKGTLTVNLLHTATQNIIEVTDTGKGISKANIKNVFKPGFTTKKRGWGLGLTLTKRIIEQYHKGTIFIKNSELGKGTTFRIELNKGDV